MSFLTVSGKCSEDCKCDTCENYRCAAETFASVNSEAPPRVKWVNAKDAGCEDDGFTDPSEWEKNVVSETIRFLIPDACSIEGSKPCQKIILVQQLRLNESQRALLLDIGIDVNEIGEGRPIVLKFT
jgi:hypothetical protein